MFSHKMTSKPCYTYQVWELTLETAEEIVSFMSSSYPKQLPSPRPLCPALPGESRGIPRDICCFSTSPFSRADLDRAPLRFAFPSAALSHWAVLKMGLLQSGARSTQSWPWWCQVAVMKLRAYRTPPRTASAPRGCWKCVGHFPKYNLFAERSWFSSVTVGNQEMRITSSTKSPTETKWAPWLHP